MKSMGRKVSRFASPGKERFVRFKRWARGIPPKRFRRASFIHNLTAVSWKTCRASNMGGCTAVNPAAKIDRAAGAVLSLSIRIGRTSSQSRAVQVMPFGRMPTKLDQRIRQMEFLSRTTLTRWTQLETHRQAKLGEIIQLTAERKALYKTSPDSPRIQRSTPP